MIVKLLIRRLFFRNSRLRLSPQIGAVLGFDDAGGASQRQLRQVVAEEAFDQVALSRGKSGLRGDQGQVVVHAGVDAVGFVGKGAGGEVNIGAGDFDQPGRRADVEQSRADLLVDAVGDVVELGVDAGELGAGNVHVAADLRLAKDGEGEIADGGEVAVCTDSVDGGGGVVTFEGESGPALMAVAGARGTGFVTLGEKVVVILSASIR